MKKAIGVIGLFIFGLPLLFIFLISGASESTVTAVPANASLNEEQMAFVSQILPAAEEGLKDGIFPSVTIAQAILESGWGKSGLAKTGKNLFGIKADSSWKGATMDLPTQEEVNGGMITIIARWRVYTSWNDSVRDHTKFLLENSNYKRTGVFKAKNYEEQAHALKRAGYATESNYAESVIQVINDFGLSMYDIPGGGQSSSGNKVIEDAINAGMKWVGKSPYCWGGGRNNADIKAGRFDCSSLVHYCYASAGITLGDKSSVTTWSLLTLGKSIDKKDMKRGDIIFFDTVGSDTHVAIYLGNNKFLNDSSSKGVSIGDLNNSYWKSKFNGKVRRVVN